MKLLKSWRIAADRVFAELYGGLISNAANWQAPVTVTYGAAPAINAALGNTFVMTITDAVAFVFAAPTNPPATGYSQTLELTLLNSAGAAHGAGTFNAVFLTSGPVPAIPDGGRWTIRFRWDGTNWIEQWRGFSTGGGPGGDGSLNTITYGPAPAINAALGTYFVMTVTDAVAFAFAAPTNPPTVGTQVIVITIRNGSGGAHGAGTFNAVFKTSAAVPAIANANSRSFCFRWDGTNWVELWRTAADVAN